MTRQHFLIHEANSVFIELSQSITISEFIILLQKHGYRFCQDYVTKRKQAYGYLCSKLIVQHFPNGIKLYGAEALSELRIKAENAYAT